LAEDVGHLLHRQLDFEDVAARLAAGAAGGVLAGGAERLSRLAVTLTDAAAALGAVLGLRGVDLRPRGADEGPALLADHFAAADVLRQVAFHLAAHELLEALVIAFDFLSHGPLHPSSPALFTFRALGAKRKQGGGVQTTSSCVRVRRCWRQTSAR